MYNNIVMFQIDDLKQVVAEIVESMFSDRLPQKGEVAQDEYLTRDEACARLHVTFTTIWRMTNKGVLHVHKIGRRNLYSKSEIDALIANGIAEVSPVKYGYGRQLEKPLAGR